MICDVTVTRIYHSAALHQRCCSHRSYSNQLCVVGYKHLLPVCETMSLGTTDAYYSPQLTTSDPFLQFSSGRYSCSSDGLKFHVSRPVQSMMMYNARQRDVTTTTSSFTSATASPFNVRCSPALNDYDYVPSSPYARPSTDGQSTGDYNTALTTEKLAAAYRHGLDRVHGPSMTSTSQQPGFAIYPWMRSMTAGTFMYSAKVRWRRSV